MLDNLYQESTDQILDDRVARPLPEPAARPSFGVNVWNTVTATPKALVALGNESSAFGSDMLGAFGSIQAGYGLQADPSLLFDPVDREKRTTDGQKARQDIQTGEAFSTELGTNLRARARDLMPDPVTSNVAEELIFGLVRFGGKAIGYGLTTGPAAPIFLGIDEGMTEADRLKAEGVDFSTRTKVGAVAGLSSAAAVALPVAGNTVKQTVGLVAVGGPGGFIAQQATSKAILENAGYDKIADQYDPFDPVGLAVSTLIPAGFGAYTMRGAKANPKAAPVADPVAARQVLDMGGNERLALKHDDPRLDAYAVIAAQREGIPPEALLAIKNVGEKSDPTAVSPKGAKGVMQFLDSTWNSYGKGNPSDPVASIDAGARYMKDLIEQYGGNVRAAIAHYNGGTKAGKAVMKGKAPPAKETQDYLSRTDTYLAERQGTDIGKAISNDPEAIAAARVALMRETVESMNLHAADDIPGITKHVDAVGRASDQLAAGERVDLSDVIEAERIDLARAVELVNRMGLGKTEAPEVLYRGITTEGQESSKGIVFTTPDREMAGRYAGETGKVLELNLSKGNELDLSHLPSVSRFEDVFFALEDRVGIEAAERITKHVRTNTAEEMDTYSITRTKEAVEAFREAGIDAVRFKQLTGGSEGVTVAVLNKGKLQGLPGTGKPDGTNRPANLPNAGKQGGAPASVESVTRVNGQESSALDSQVSEITRLAPDMLVQLDGMDAPMKLSDALEAVKMEAANDAKDAPLLQVAAECALMNA